MAWVQLGGGSIDGGGSVVAVFGGPQPGNPSVIEVADSDPRIGVFLHPTETAQQAAIRQLRANDDTMFRALELLIDALLARGVILATDFPPAVRTMYQARKALRVTAGQP